MSPHFTRTVFTFTNSRIPCSPDSRPQPDRFTAPKGSRASDATIPLIDEHHPRFEFIDEALLFAGASLVHALAPKPK